MGSGALFVPAILFLLPTPVLSIVSGIDGLVSLLTDDAQAYHW